MCVFHMYVFSGWVHGCFIALILISSSQLLVVYAVQLLGGKNSSQTTISIILFIQLMMNMNIIKMKNSVLVVSNLSYNSIMTCVYRFLQ